MATIRSTDFALWAGTATVATFAPTADDHRRAVASVEAWLRHVDRVASTYRVDSQLAELNTRRGKPFSAGPTLTAMLTAALAMARGTSGLVDPTVGTVTLNQSGSLTVTRRVTYRDISVRATSSGSLVTMLPGMQLDLGATAKAWAADQAAQIAATAANGGALVSLLGDVAVTGPAPESGWSIRVTDDHREGARTTNPSAQTISITSGGLATSGTNTRAFVEADGTVSSHIIDPRTMRPVGSSWRTVTVAAPSCLVANAASTTAVILGESAPSWLHRTGLPARLIGKSGLPVALGHWPAELSYAA